MSLRRAFSLTIALFLSCNVLAGCHAHNANSGLIPVKFQADWYPQPEHGGFYDAIVKGYYKDEGLDVEIIPGGPYVSSDALVASGAVQFGMNSSDHILQAVANANEPIVAIGATMQHDPQGIMVHADSPVHTWTDLNGHTVAVKPGSTWWEFIEKKFELDQVHEIPATYSVANFLQDPNYMQQAFVTSEPYFAQRAGVATRMLLNRDAGYDPYRVFFTSRAYAAAHPDIVAKFTQASIRGWRDYMKDPSAANALIEKLNPALNPEWVNYSWKALKTGHYISGDDAAGDQTGQFDPARWDVLYHQLLDLHVIQRPIDPASAYSVKFLK
ncbi:MAG: ABC transporter substrate-binding protein [Acidobacteriaceae bacterium]